MTFYQIGRFSSICFLHGSVIFRKQKIAFSADQLILQKRKLDFSITKLCRYEFEAMVKSGYYIVPSSSTALQIPLGKSLFQEVIKT